MTRVKTLLLAALGLAGLPALATDYNAFVAVGGMKTTAGFYNVICDRAGCFDSVFTTTPGPVAAVSGVYGDGIASFDGWAEGWHSNLLTLHAGAGFSASGALGVDGHRWYANSQVSVNTTLVSYWTEPDEAVVRLFYRFDGSSSSSATGPAEAVAYGRVFGSTLGQQAVDCAPVAELPGQCMVEVAGLASGEVFDYSVTLQAITSLDVISPGAYSGTAEADYTHTLTWVGAALLNQKTGAPLTGWTLALAEDDTVLFSSPVPEPPAALLAALGLAALAWRRRA